MAFLPGIVYRFDDLAMSPKHVVAFNFTLMGVAITVGWIAAQAATVPGDLLSSMSGTGDEADVFRDLSFILKANLGVILIALLGAVTMGLLSGLVVVWNGYHLGFGLALVVDSTPERALALMRYLPFEFVAITMASAAGMLLSRYVVGELFEGSHESTLGRLLPSAVRLAAGSLLLIVLAALLEVHVRGELIR